MPVGSLRGGRALEGENPPRPDPAGEQEGFPADPDTGSSPPPTQTVTDESEVKSYVLENQLPKKVQILGDFGQRILLAPFERREIPAGSLVHFDRRRLRASVDVRLADKSEEQPLSVMLAGLWPVAFAAYWIGGSAIDRVWFWWSFPVVLAFGLLIWWLKNQRGATEILRWLKQSLSLGLVAILAFGIPTFAILYYARPFPPAPGTPLGFDLWGSPPVLVGRVMQLIFISLAALVPALMYFAFDREQLGTLRTRFVHQVFRLDSSLDRLSDLQAKYGAQMEEVYGSASAARARLLAGRLSPILMATVLLTLGWTIALLNPNVTLQSAGPASLLALFEPAPTPLVFGFLGAYFFAIQLVLRSYLRGDLRPKSYGHISVRVLVVAILSWVLSGIGLVSEGNLLALVFIAGIVPDTAVRWIKEAARGTQRWRFLRNDSNAGEPMPLSLLEGIDLYDLTRLGDEGITNIEALAHHELVDLMLKTRIPAPRLVDWVDQAIFFLHVSGDRSEHAASETNALLNRLKKSGVRTATDLITVWRDMTPDEREEFSTRLGLPSAASLKTLLSTFRDDEWLAEIMHWRRAGSAKREIQIIDARTPVADPV